MYLPLNVSSFSSFKSSVSQIPVLSRDEELVLASDLTEENAKKLIMSHLRFVMYVVNSYSGYKISEEDLVQEGIIGLMKAVKKFDPTRGYRLASYAMFYIKNAIQEFVIKNFRIAKVATTKAQRKLFFGLRQFIADNNDYTYDDISDHFNVDKYDVIDMHKRMTSSDMSIASDDTDDFGNFSANVGSTLKAPDNSKELETKVVYDLVLDKIEELPTQQKYIVYNRWLVDKKKTLSELGKEFNISSERVRQIEHKAFSTIKGELSCI
jgi:RNA polymerase sigma-32 factor